MKTQTTNRDIGYLRKAIEEADAWRGFFRTPELWEPHDKAIAAMERALDRVRADRKTLRDIK